MSWAELYTELKGWQTAIGSGFGFVALMLGALFNFHLNRRRDAAIRKDEVKAIAIAFYSEIVLLREEVAAMARIIAERHGTIKIDDQFIADARPPQPILYLKLADKLGLLPPHLVLLITAFHADYQTACEHLPLMVNKGREFEYSVLSVLVPAELAVNRIRPALREIEALAGIVVPASDPDIGRTKAVIERETEQRAALKLPAWSTLVTA